MPVAVDVSIVSIVSMSVLVTLSVAEFVSMSSVHDRFRSSVHVGHVWAMSECWRSCPCLFPCS